MFLSGRFKISNFDRLSSFLLHFKTTWNVNIKHRLKQILQNFLYPKCQMYVYARFELKGFNKNSTQN